MNDSLTEPIGVEATFFSYDFHIHDGEGNLKFYHVRDPVPLYRVHRDDRPIRPFLVDSLITKQQLVNAGLTVPLTPDFETWYKFSFLGSSLERIKS